MKYLAIIVAIGAAIRFLRLEQDAKLRIDRWPQLRRRRSGAAQPLKRDRIWSRCRPPVGR
jgi:hypothetical protein